MSAKGLGRVKTPTFNLRVETSSRFRKFENQKCLRPLLREDDRENNSAHSWLVHVFTQPGSKTDFDTRNHQVRFAPQERTSSVAPSPPVSAISRSRRHELPRGGALSHSDGNARS